MPHRFEHLKVHLFGQSADVVMALDYVRRIAADGDTFDHIGIKRSLREELKLLIGFRGVLVGFGKVDNRIFEYFDELVADNLSLFLRIHYSAQLCQETFRSINVFEFNVKVFAENPLNDFFLARTQQTVVDEDTGKLVANRLMQQRSYNRGVDPATKTENYFVVADLRTHSFAGVVNE